MAFLYTPLFMYLSAIDMPNIKPEHAAPISNATAFDAPILACTRHAVEGVV